MTVSRGGGWNHIDIPYRLISLPLGRECSSRRYAAEFKDWIKENTAKDGKMLKKGRYPNKGEACIDTKFCIKNPRNCQLFSSGANQDPRVQARQKFDRQSTPSTVGQPYHNSRFETLSGQKKSYFFGLKHDRQKSAELPPGQPHASQQRTVRLPHRPLAGARPRRTRSAAWHGPLLPGQTWPDPWRAAGFSHRGGGEHDMDPRKT